MYGDIATGTLSTYVYNGMNNSNSILNPGTWLQTDTFTNTGGNISIDIDATAINESTEWDTPTAGDINGVGYDNKIGAWFHVSKNSTFGYDDVGDIISYTYGSQG